MQNFKLLGRLPADEPIKIRENMPAYSNQAIHGGVDDQAAEATRQDHAK